MTPKVRNSGHTLTNVKFRALFFIEKLIGKIEKMHEGVSITSSNICKQIAIWKFEIF